MFQSRAEFQRVTLRLNKNNRRVSIRRMIFFMFYSLSSNFFQLTNVLHSIASNLHSKPSTTLSNVIG